MISLINKIRSRFGLTLEVRHELSNPIQEKATIISIEKTTLRLSFGNKDISFLLNNQTLPPLIEGEKVDIEYRERGFRTYNFSPKNFRKKLVIEEDIVYFLQKIKDKDVHAISQAIS